MKLPALSSQDQDRARIVLIVISTLCVIAVILVLAVVVLTSIHEAVPTELWTITTSITTAMVALLVKVSSGTDTPTPDQPVPVAVADEPVQVEVAPSASTPAIDTTTFDATPSTGSGLLDGNPTILPQRPSPYPGSIS